MLSQSCDRMLGLAVLGFRFACTGYLCMSRTMLPAKILNGAPRLPLGHEVVDQGMFFKAEDYF